MKTGYVVSKWEFGEHYMLAVSNSQKLADDFAAQSGGHCESTEFLEADDFDGSSAAINALPEKLRLFVHDLQTRCDPSGDTQALFALRQNITALGAENERLKRGEFTPEEFQNLCHNRDETPGCTLASFSQGCREYQRKLFGKTDCPELDAYDAGILADFGGGDVQWWHDYIRALLSSAQSHYTSQLESYFQ